MLPPNIVEIKEDGWKKGGYVILSEETGLVIHYLSEWERFLYEDEETTEPLCSYDDFVKIAYAENPEAVARLLQAAKEGPLIELERLRREFNSFLQKGQPPEETIRTYCDRVEEILRR